MSSGWPLTKLGDVLRPTRRGEPVDSVREYRLLGVRLDGHGPFLRETVLGSATSAGRLFRVAVGDFIYSRLFAWRGAFGVVPGDLDGCYVSGEFLTYEPNADRLDVQFLRLWFRLPGTLDRVADDCSGSTPLTRNRFKEQFLLSLEIPLPPLAEQQRIVARIEEVAGKVKEAKRLREQSSDRCNELTTTVTSCVFNDLAHVELLPIRALGVGGENPIQTGPFGAQLHRTEFVEDGVPVLNVGNVWPEGLRLDSLDHVTSVKAVQLARYSVKAGDLLFARSGATLGKVCIVPEQCDGWLMTGHLFRVRFDPTRVSNLFAFAALRGDRVVRDRVSGFVRGATRPGFNTTLLGSVELPIPPLDVQQRVVTYLDRVSGFVTGIRSLHERSGAELDALLPAVLDRAFKGEL